MGWQSFEQKIREIASFRWRINAVRPLQELNVIVY